MMENLVNGGEALSRLTEYLINGGGSVKNGFRGWTIFIFIHFIKDIRMASRWSLTLSKSEF